MRFTSRSNRGRNSTAQLLVANVPAALPARSGRPFLGQVHGNGSSFGPPSPPLADSRRVWVRRVGNVDVEVRWVGPMRAMTLSWPPFGLFRLLISFRWQSRVPTCRMSTLLLRYGACGRGL